VNEPVLTLLQKPGCHLCHEMKGTLLSLLGEGRLVERDVEEDPALRRRYLLHIPVLLFGDEELARHRASREELAKALVRVGLL
jgi:hypothetical protein